MQVSKLLGVTFDGHKEQAMALFAELEKRAPEKKKGDEAVGKGKKKST